MFEIDHVIAPVADLDAAAERLLAEHGLASVPGGRHPGHGTANRIVPLGGAYLELMAVVDPEEAESSPLGRWASDSAAPGAVRGRALCLRTVDINLAVAVAGAASPMSRETPDGVTLRWSLAGLSGMIEDSLPFFIQWHCPPQLHPASAFVAHRIEPVGQLTVVHGRVPDAWDSVLGTVPGLSFAEGRGVLAIEVGAGPTPVSIT